MLTEDEDGNLIVIKEGTNLEWCTRLENARNPNTQHKGYHLSEETREKMSIAQKRRYRENPENHPFARLRNNKRLRT
jgi:hypothetical protein